VSQIDPIFCKQLP